MSGDKSGVQTLVKQRFPKAGYIHCRAHVLNLVLLHSCTNNKKSARFFNTISSLAAFFSQSPKRSETLKQFMETHIPNVCKTKWSYNSRMIKIIDSNYAAINECLGEIYLGYSVFDAETCTTARGLHAFMLEFNTVFLLKLFANIFAHTDVLYQILQTKELDVVECLRNVKACLASIEELKAEHHFYRTLNDAIDVSGETVTDSNGINYRPINILYLISFILGQNLHQTFSETLRLARMTLPITTASIERTFSVLRRIKNYLRSKSGQNRLFGIMMMAVEKDLLHEMMLTPLFYDDIIDKFALKVNRRIPLLYK
ncbi:zinc finger MYM-type protein 1-like [Wyeomyia smithii]|uniref:zinc finger MYM-type protein 1-like n=1 Tax=Wyeomyia smithii TaxID=174621 RepID=UPI00246822BB|nr:zinc finger MYM-type protein 1-like [Wyeomyia smithii]